MKKAKFLTFVTLCFFMMLVAVPCRANLIDVNIVKQHNVSMAPKTSLLMQAPKLKNLKWKSSNTKVASIKSFATDTIIVSAKKTGTATISASAKGKTYKCVIKVKKLKKAYFSFENKKDPNYESLADKIMTVGESALFYIGTKPDISFNDAMSVKSLKSSNPSVLGISPDSDTIFITAKKPGKATISAKIANKKIKYKITVEKPRISLSCGDNISLGIGKSLTVNVNTNINIISINQTGNSVRLTTNKAGSQHSINGKYKFTLKGIRNGVSKFKICQNTGSSAPVQKILTVSVGDPISRIKNIIQTSGYTNYNNQKFIVTTITQGNTETSFGIIDAYSDNRLRFYTYMKFDEQHYAECSMDVSNQNAGVIPTIFYNYYKNGTYKTEKSVLKRNLTKKNFLNFVIKERTGAFKYSSLETNIQDTSNSTLNASLSGWDYLLSTKCGSSLAELGFTSY